MVQQTKKPRLAWFLKPTLLETGEVYYCLKGHGYMLLENPEGDWSAQEMHAGEAVYVPPRYAHRSINVSPDEQLITFFVYRADAGHDYGTIETKGYRKLIVELSPDAFSEASPAPDDGSAVQAALPTAQAIAEAGAAAIQTILDQEAQQAAKLTQKSGGK